MAATLDLPDDLPKKGHYVAPRVYTGVAPDDALATDELFGPILAVFKVKTFAEAIEVANSTDYALTAGVFSRSPENLETARRELVAGNIYLNRGCTGALVNRQPFGGYKLSGVGTKAGGPDYLRQFLIPVNVTENTMRRGFAPGAAKAPGPRKGVIVPQAGRCVRLGRRVAWCRSPIWSRPRCPFARCSPPLYWRFLLVPQVPRASSLRDLPRAARSTRWTAGAG